MFSEFAYITIKRKFVSSVQIKKNIISVSNAIVIHSKITIGRYWHSNRLIPIIDKTADNRPIPIIGRLLVHP